ncbi:MAG: bifunctional DNA-binding transcriptional regulator/O6-methylguanine-DNA methyltransferase Ada [Chloracidobacterium sp.]|nr:bifunctional DNA-binding transcriptional regulator/O6-methylguanine-DNA methyltransferase Ada [Chloracidobacterium sp.]
MDRELYWQAVETNDARFDGAFVIGVKTTGIYCRPSCRARLPNRANVDFYATVGAAENNGFRACKRCRPNEVNSVDPQVDRVLRVCELIDGDALTLGELAAAVGLSSYHLQRSFKEIIGITPKKYAEAKRMERFKDELRSGSDVVTAMYEAGFGSSSRLYEKASDGLGMTPAVYKKGGQGMKINYTIADCELGKLLVARTKRGICSVTFGDTKKELADGLSREFPNAEITEASDDLANTVDAIIKYLLGKSRRLVLPLDLQATAFQMQVWDFLRKIPYGETRSYAEIAEALGDKKKVRAVAQACAKNRVAVLIPCHRVVASDGKLSGYRWGVERKAKLLARERTATHAE